jgi:chemotaxis protein MotD
VVRPNRGATGLTRQILPPDSAKCLPIAAWRSVIDGQNVEILGVFLKSAMAWRLQSQGRDRTDQSGGPVPNAAALNPATTARPAFSRADFRATDQQAPDFAGLLDAGSETPPRDPAPPRSDSPRTIIPRRADAANSDPPAAQPADAAPAATRGDAPAAPPKPAPENAVNAATGKSETKSEGKSPDEKSADASTAAVAADLTVAAQAVAAPLVADTTIAVAAPVAVAIVLNAAPSTPAPETPGDAVAPVQPGKLQTAPAGVNTATAAVAKAESAVGAAIGTPQPDVTAENLSIAIAASLEPAPNPRAKLVAAATQKSSENDKASENTNTGDVQPMTAQAGGAPHSAPALDQVSAFVKSLHVVNNAKPHNGERAAATGTDGAVALDSTLAAAAPANNLPTPAPVGIGAITFGVDGMPSTKAAGLSSAGTDTTVPVAGLAVEIATRAKDGNNRFDIRLDPPELGRIHVRLDIDGNGNVTSQLLVDRADTLDLLRRDFSGLERALNDAGLKTGDNSLQFAMRDQGFAGGQPQGGEFANAARVVVPGEVDVPIGTPRYNLPRLGGVDIRV